MKSIYRLENLGLLKDFAIFTVLKKIVLISILLIGLTFTSFAQNRPSGTGDPVTKMLKPYPIPASSVINFDFQYGYDRSYSLQIYNFMGKKVSEIGKVLPKFTVPLDEFYRGIYIYQLRDKNGKIIDSGKFQVVK